MAQLTIKQELVLTFIKDHINKHGYAPSYREIAKAHNIKSISTVHGYMERLERANAIEHKAHGARAIRVI